MARKLRIQFEKAFYHVVNRGNYRRDVFESAGAAQAFVSVLEETTQIFGWRIYAYVVMRNHFHVVLQTPRPNLVEGMHWMQCTLATRFNRYRSERGHLFQGRYHAGLIEEPRMLAHVVDFMCISIRCEHRSLQLIRPRISVGAVWDDFCEALAFRV